MMIRSIFVPPIARLLPGDFALCPTLAVQLSSETADRKTAIRSVAHDRKKKKKSRKKLCRRSAAIFSLDSANRNFSCHAHFVRFVPAVGRRCVVGGLPLRVGGRRHRRLREYRSGRSIRSQPVSRRFIERGRWWRRWRQSARAALRFRRFSDAAPDTADANGDSA